jgi:hypothetical protein
VKQWRSPQRTESTSMVYSWMEHAGIGKSKINEFSCQVILFPPSQPPFLLIHCSLIFRCAFCPYFSGSIDRSSRLYPRRTCEQEHVALSNAFQHNSVASATIRARMSALVSDLRCVVMGQYAMGPSLVDRSI